MMRETLAFFVLSICLSASSSFFTLSQCIIGAVRTPPALLATYASPSPALPPRTVELKDDLIALAEKTRRGFSATSEEKNKVKQIIKDLSSYSPSEEPAAAYYAEKELGDRATLAGKWTLIYTDAPDITSLEGGPLSLAKLGKIGQECSPPYIKNVIEWKRPDWASSLPFSGSESSRVLQKVCCKGSSSKRKPTEVDLKLVGLEIVAAYDNTQGTLDNSQSSGPPAFFENFPVKLEGPLSLTFGKFNILYLDSEMRITKTYQGFTAVNIREDKEWF